MEEGNELTEEAFPEVIKKLEPEPRDYFNDPNYYKTVLADEGEPAKKLHGLLQKYLNTKDPKEKGVYRQNLIPAYWEFLAGVSRKCGGDLSRPKKFLLRFGILHPTFLNGETRDFFSRVVVENTLDQPIYYVDEWLQLVGSGTIKPSTTDEARITQSNNQARLQQLIDKAVGKLKGARSLLKAKTDEKIQMEQSVTARLRVIAEHRPVEGIPGVYGCFNDPQKRALNEIQELLRNLLRNDREMETCIKDFRQAEGDVKTLNDKLDEEGKSPETDMGAIDTEFNTLRQMAKMTVGRQGNHFPFLTSEYFHSGPQEVATRENVIQVLSWIESIDPDAFGRLYKNKVNRIAPFVVLIPSYGEYGMCWEPFDRYNRATSRARLAVPLYPKNLKETILWAVGDLRWQAAKEKASYYWMEEGLTGDYYQWFQKMKLKTDLKETFIQDYILWITKESEGVQRLDKEIRGAFWRYMPFAQSIKDTLKTRSYIYQELYQRDVNRAMSDGY
jgi:hypothetical protein